MRKLIAAAGLVLVAAAPAAAQEIGEEIVLTGCLASEGEAPEVEFLLGGVDAEAAPAARIELFAEPDLALAPHVGHTVEVTGKVVAEAAAEPAPAPVEPEEGEQEEQEGEQEAEVEPQPEAEGQKLNIQVDALRHVAGTCEPQPQDGTGLPR